MKKLFIVLLFAPVQIFAQYGHGSSGGWGKSSSNSDYITNSGHIFRLGEQDNLLDDLNFPLQIANSNSGYGSGMRFFNNANGYTANDGIQLDFSPAGHFTFANKENADIRFFTGGTGGSSERVRVYHASGLWDFKNAGAIQLHNMTTTQRDALTAANGMMLYNTTTNTFQFYENGAWVDRNAAYMIYLDFRWFFWTLGAFALTIAVVVLYREILKLQAVRKERLAHAQ
jgi:hypothetical protein